MGAARMTGAPLMAANPMEGDTTMRRDQIATTGAPAAIGPYSQAIATEGLVFASGQIALDPASGQLAAGDVRVQTRQAIENLSAVLEAAGSSLTHVVKTTVFLTKMSDFAAMNEVYGQFFAVEPPARSTVAVAELPRGAQVEVEAIAVRASH
jgi:2-iminobutanoate/2-iminopropanoate deaminase